jgi:S1-C subfamily serine protease
MTEQDEPIKSYFPIPKPLAEMTKEERRQFATEFAEFALKNANQLSPPGLNDKSINDVSGEIDSQSRLKKAVAKARKPVSFLNRHIKRFAGALAVIAILLGGTGVYLGTGPYLNYQNTDPTSDGFVPPRSIEGLVDRVQASTVTVFCDYSKEDYVQGSGWAIELPISNQKDFPTTLITNHHVIEECLGSKGKIAVKIFSGKEFPAYIDRWDKENDLAVIGTKAKIVPLQLSEWSPFPGYWVMATGTADGFEGSIAFGNVLNTTDTDILITAAISHGNSGGPLVDNEGNVVGTNSWRSKAEQYNGAVSLDAMCIKIMKCQGKYFWSRN